MNIQIICNYLNSVNKNLFMLERKEVGYKSVYVYIYIIFFGKKYNVQRKVRKEII